MALWGVPVADDMRECGLLQFRMMVGREHAIIEPRGTAEAVICLKADRVGAPMVDAHEWLGKTITKDQQIFSVADDNPLRGPCCGSRSERPIPVPAALAAAPLVMSRSSSRWDFHFHSYVLMIYVRLY